MPNTAEHVVLFYDQDDECLGKATEFVRAGRSRGERGLLLTSQDRWQLVGYGLAENADIVANAPDVVAATIIEALEAPVPATRYAIGNAVELLEKRRVSSDVEMDLLFNQMLPGNRPVLQSADPA